MFGSIDGSKNQWLVKLIDNWMEWSIDGIIYWSIDS